MSLPLPLKSQSCSCVLGPPDLTLGFLFLLEQCLEGCWVGSSASLRECAALKQTTLCCPRCGSVPDESQALRRLPTLRRRAGHVYPLSLAPVQPVAQSRWLVITIVLDGHDRRPVVEVTSCSFAAVFSRWRFRQLHHAHCSEQFLYFP